MSFRRIGLAYASSLLNVFSGLLSNIILMRVVADQIGQVEFGQYTLAAQSALFVGFVQLGLDFAAVRQIAECLGRGDQVGAANVYRTLRRFNRILAVGCVGCSAAVTGLIWYWFGDGILPPVVALLGLSQAVQFATRPALSTLSASEHLPVVNAVAVVRSIGITLLALSLLAAGASVVALPVSELVGMAVSWWVIERYRVNRCRWSNVGREFSGFGPLLRFGAVTGVGGLAWTIEAASDVYLLQALAADGSAAVAEYSFWARLPHLAFLLSTQFVFSSFPTMAARSGEESKSKRRFLLRLVWVTAGLGGLAGIGIAIWLPAVMHHWLSGRYDRPDATLVSLAAGCMLTTRLFGNLFGMYLLAGGYSGRVAIVNWVQTTVKICVSVWLFRDLHLAGLFAGSAIAACVSVAVLLGLLVAAESTSVRAVVPLAVGAVAVPVVCWLGTPVIAEWTVLQVLLGILFTTAVWVTAWGGLMAVFGQLRSHRPSPQPVCVGR